MASIYRFARRRERTSGIQKTHRDGATQARKEAALQQGLSD